MPHRTGLAAWLAASWAQLGASAQSLIILIAALAGRTIYKGGHVRQFIGEAVLLAVVLHVITPRIISHIPSLSPHEVSAILGLGGIHLLRFIVKRKTGIDLNEQENNQNE
jgi:hypothetical protein